MSEQDTRLALLQSLLTTPHRALDTLVPLHEQIIRQDPRFYGQLAAWYAHHGDVRDHKEMFVIQLCVSSYPGHRDEGLALLRQMPPYQVERVVRFIKGARRVEKPHPQPAAKGTPRQRTPRKAAPATPPKPEWVGLKRNVPLSMVTEVERYLREREQTPERLDKALASAASSMQFLYAALHIAPCARAQAILFDHKPPEGSLAALRKQIAQLDDPAEQARLIVEHRIPYRQAVALIKQVTPTVLAALINAMTPQEVINHMGALKKRGALEHEDLKPLVEEKLVKAQTNQLVSAYKAKVAIEAAGVTGDLKEQLEEVTQQQIRHKGRITRSTALFVDKSGSMHASIELAKRLGAMISAICDAPLYVVAFDSMPRPIEVGGERKLVDWEAAFRGEIAGGHTSLGAPLELLHRRQQWVEQIVFITDEDETCSPRVRDSLISYMEAGKVKPEIIIIKVPNERGLASDYLEQVCQTLGIAPTVFAFDPNQGADYYAQTNLLPLLSRPGMLDLLLEILDYPIPKRRAS